MASGPGGLRASTTVAPPPNPYIEVDLRTGLRIEQITAKLQTLALEMDVRDDDVDGVAVRPSGRQRRDYRRDYRRSHYRDRRYYCRRGSGTTGLIIGGAAGPIPETLTEENLSETFGVQIKLSEDGGRYAARAH